MDKFFGENPEEINKNWEVKAMKDYTNADDEGKKRILKIYEYNPKFEGVYLNEAEKMQLEKNIPEEPEKPKRIKVKNKSKSITKDNI